MPRPSQGQVRFKRAKWALRAIKTARDFTRFFSWDSGYRENKASVPFRWFHLGALREEAGACGVVWGNWFSNRIIFDTTVGGMVYRVGIWNKKTDCSRRLRH